MKRRRFTPEFKRSIIEQLISKAAGPAEICRRYNLSSGQLYTWKKQYTQGHFEPEPSKETELVVRVAELERMLGKATLENELLKKAAGKGVQQTQENESTLSEAPPLSKALKGSTNEIDYFRIYVLLTQTMHALRKIRQKDLISQRITVDQASVLGAITTIGSKVTISEISRRIVREHHSIFEILNRMEGKGLIQKTKESGKSKRIKIKASLTDKGIEAYEQLLNNRKSIKAALSSLDTDEKEQLWALLRKVLKNTLKQLGNKYEMPPPAEKTNNGPN